MSNNSNYIQATENVQQKDKNIQTFKITKQQFEENKFLNDTIQKPRYAIGFLYLITHKETGYMYSGSHLSYSLKDANTYCGSSKGKTISDICKKDNILQNGIDQYEFKLIMFCKSGEQMRELEDELNHFNIYFNKLKCLNGRGRNLRSTAGIPTTQEVRQKQSNSHNNRTSEQKEETRQKKSKSLKGKNKGKNPYANKTQEEILEINQKQSETMKGKNKGKNPLANKTEDEKVTISKKKSDKLSGENNPMFGKNPLANKTEKEMKLIGQKHSEIASRKYYCPHNQSIQRDARNMVQYIRKNYPNEKQWEQFTKEEKKSYLVVLQDDAGLIAN